MEGEAGAARRVAVNAVNPFVAQVFTKLLMLVYTVVQFRVLGNEGGVLGNYLLAGILLMYASTVSEWGLGTLLTREVAQQRGASAKGHADVTRLFTQTLALRLLLSLALFVPIGLIILLYATYSGFSTDGVWAMLILALSLLPGAFSGTVTSVLYAYERMTLPAVVGIATSMLNVALGLGMLWLGWGIVGLALAALLATLVTAVLFWRIWRRELPGVAMGLSLSGLRIDGPSAAALLRSGWSLLLNGLLVGLFFRVDQFIIEPVLGGEGVERYQAAYSYLNFVLLITPAVTLALFPRMSRHAKEDMPRLAREYGFALKVLLALSGMIVVGTFWFAPLLITVVTGGKEGFLPGSAIALQILILFLPFSFVNGVTQYILIALDKQSLITRAFALTLAFNVAMNLVLVPIWGIAGAALVTVLSEIVLLVPLLWWVRRTLAPSGGMLDPGLAWKPALAALTAGLLMYALWSVFDGWNQDAGSIALYLGVGVLLVVVYASVLLALRPFTSEEIEALVRIRRSS